MKDITVHSDITVRQAMKKLNNTGGKCLVVVDEKNTLLGTLSDGDLRKAILKSVRFNDLVEGIYQSNPTVLIEGKYNLDEAKKLFIRNKFDLIPIVDQEAKVVDVLLWEKVFKNKQKKQEM